MPKWAKPHTNGITMNQEFKTVCVSNLPTGRLLAWDEYGDPSGQPLYFHRSPQNRLLGQAIVDAVERGGVRLLSRPPVQDVATRRSMVGGPWGVSS